MEDFLRFLTSKMEEPGLLSWWHFIALIIIIGATITVAILFKNTSEKIYKRILLIFWIVLIILEIFKQIAKSFHYDNPSYWEYSYRDFPFGLCSMVYYFLPIIIFVNKDKHPKIVDAAIGYLSFISLSAGILVCIYPEMATSQLVYINIQTFIHHGSQVILGVFIYIWNRRNVTIKTYLRALIAFAITVVIAIIINISFQPHYINMFFINPLIITNLPIGNIIQEKAGYPVYLLVYITVISLVAYLTYLVETSIYKLVEKKKAKTSQPESI